MLTPDQLKNLPEDTRKEYLQTLLLLDEKKKEQAIKDDFLSFVKHMWPDFIEGEHHKIMAEKFNRVARGDLKRLIINMAPRHTKSEFASNYLPAWMIGNKPDLKIIQATNNAELAVRFGRKAKTLMEQDDFKKYLIHDLEKIQKPRANGKRIKAANIMQRVLEVVSRAVERIY